MADEADEAAVTSDLLFSIALQNSKTQAHNMKPKGICHSPDCGLDIPQDLLPSQESTPGAKGHMRLFCDKTCAMEYERIKKSGRR